MESLPARGVPSQWGPLTSARDFFLQAFACPVPWSPTFIDPVVRADYIAAGFPVHAPPNPSEGLMPSIMNELQQCQLHATDEQYSTIQSSGNTGMWEKPDFAELFLFVLLLTMTPLNAQNIRVLIATRMKLVSKSFKAICADSIFSIFLPIFLVFCLALNLIFTDVTLELKALGAAIVACIPLLSAAHDMLPDLFCLYIVLTISCTFPINLAYAVGGMFLFLCITSLLCRGHPESVSWRCIFKENHTISTFKNRHLVPLSHVRAVQMVGTCIVILAVDFPTFPHKFAKSINSGLTVMDFGVGSIVFTSGAVSSYAKGTVSCADPWWSRLIKAAMHSGPLGAMGFIRLIVMSAIGKHSPLSEYGEHWNFYLTLMLVFMLGDVICTTVRHPYLAGAVGISLLTVYQMVIYALQLEEWMVEGPRSNIFTANREGILGSIGFLCLYLLGVSGGHFYMKRAYSITRDSSETQNDYRTGKSNASYWSLIICQIGWFLAFLTVGLILQNGLGLYARRRFVNLTWVVFVCGFECLGFAFGTINEMFSVSGNLHFCFHGVNNNQLVFFLAANLFVGVTNLCIRTQLQPAIAVVFIMGVYIVYLCGLSYYLGLKGKRIKLM